MPDIRIDIIADDQASQRFREIATQVGALKRELAGIRAASEEIRRFGEYAGGIRFDRTNAEARSLRSSIETLSSVMSSLFTQMERGYAASRGFKIVDPNEVRISQTELNRIGRELDQLRTTAERTARGVTTALGAVKFPSASELASVERRLRALPRPPVAAPPVTSAASEAELSIAAASTAYMIRAKADAEALADAKRQQADAVMASSQATAREATAMQSALAIEHEMVTAANAEAEADSKRAQMRQMLKEQTQALTDAEQGYANAQRYSAQQQKAAQEIERLRQSQQTFAQKVQGFFGIDRSAAAESAASIAQAAAEFEKASTSAGRAGNAVRSAGHGFASAGESASNSAYLIRKFITELDEISRGQRGQLISTIGSQIRDIGLRAGEAAGGGIRSLIAGLVQLGPTLALSGAAFGAIRLAKMTEEMGKLAQANYEAANAAGMTLQSYERLAGMMEIAGGDGEYFARAMEQVTQLIERARQDPMSNEASAVGQIFGAQTQQFLGLTDAAQQVEMLRQAWQRMGETEQRTELFTELLGRSGMRSLQTALNETSDDTSKFSQKLIEFGVILDEDQNKTLREGYEAVRLLGKAFEGLKDQVALGLSGAGSFSEGLADIVKQAKDAVVWLRQLGGAISTTLNELAGLGPDKGIWDTLTNLPSRVAEAWKAPAEEVKKQREENEKTAEAAKHPPVPGEPLPGQYGPPASAKVPFNAADTERQLSVDTRIIEDQVRIRKAQDDLDRARAAGNAAAIAKIDADEDAFVSRQLQREKELAEGAAAKATAAGDPDAGKIFLEKSKELEAQLLELRARAVERANQLKKQEYEDFAASEREKIQEAQGDWQKIIQIYQEWANKAKELFGSVSKEFQTVQKDMVKAAQDAQKQMVQEDLKYADAQSRVLENQIRINELAREAANVTSGTQSHAQAIAGYEAELAEAQAVASQEMELYDQIAHEQGATTDQKLAALEKEQEVGMRAAEQEIELAKKIAEEQKKAAEEATKAWTDFFKKEGDDMSNYLNNILERKPNALKDFIDSTRKNLLNLGENLLSQTLGKALGVDVKEGSGLGGLFTGIFEKITGIGGKKDPSQETVAAIRMGTETARKSQGILQEILNTLKQQHDKAEAGRQSVETTIKQGQTAAGGMGPIAQGTMLSLGQMKGLAEKAGFSPDDAAKMAAIAMAESKGDPYARGAAGEYGITQILPGTTGAHAEAAQAYGDPLRAMQLAKQIQESEGWGAWSTYKHGDYEKYYSAAQNVQPQPITEAAAAGQAQQALSYALTHQGEKLKDYCATLVNQSLEQAGVKGTGSGLASSFKGYGTPVSPDQVRAGDIFYKGPSGAGDTGHVGFTLGPVQADKVEVMSSHMQGAAENPAGVEERSISGMTFMRPPYSDTGDVNIARVGGADIATPNDPGALPTSATQQAGLSQVQITQSIPLDVNVKTMPQGGAGASRSGADGLAPAISSQGGFIPYPTSMPSDVKEAIRRHGLNGQGRRAYGPGVNDNQGGMLAVVHPGEMIVPADVISQMPSSQGGAYDQFGGESRGFQPVTTVQAHPGIGKGLATLLMVLGGVGAIAGLSALFGSSKDDQTKQQQQLADNLLKSPDITAGGAAQTTTQLGTGGLDLSPLATSSSGAPSTSSGSTTNPANSITSLTSSLSTVTNSLSSLNTATTGASSSMSPFSQGLNEAKSGLSVFSSALSAFKGIGGLFSGGGGLLSIFGLSGGGVIPSAAGGMIVPRFQGGGILSMLHMNEMVLPSHISQFVQNAAANNNGGGGGVGHTVHFNISAIDAKSGAQFLMNNSDTIARAYARSHRAYSTNVPRS